MGFDWSFGLSDLFGIGGDAATAAMQAREAEKNRQFQEKVYKHRHQWTTQDMRAAGINPILAAASGQPTTAGSMANMPHMGQGWGRNPGRKKFDAEHALLEAKRFTEAASAGSLNAQKNLTNELTKKATADTVNAQEQALRSMFEREMLGRQHKAAMELPDAFYLFDQGAQRLGPSANALKDIMLGLAPGAWLLNRQKKAKGIAAEPESMLGKKPFVSKPKGKPREKYKGGLR